MSYFLFIFIKRKKSRSTFFILNKYRFFKRNYFFFLFGTITADEYSKVFFPTNNKFIKYGAIFYVILRMIKESIKTPIHIVLLVSIVIAVTPYFQDIINNILLSWDSVIAKQTT